MDRFVLYLETKSNMSDVSFYKLIMTIIVLRIINFICKPIAIFIILIPFEMIVHFFTGFKYYNFTIHLLVHTVAFVILLHKTKKDRKEINSIIKVILQACKELYNEKRTAVKN